ncbi:MAG: GNAT family N-acetyltransferase [Flavobacteriales bacterium]|nr:GNAT family N-acetyltransferase [Flavobacteriales bacterium]
MIELHPFTEDDFTTFMSWITTKEDLFQFAGPIFSYPLTKEQLLNYLGMTDKKPFKVGLTESQKTIGHCEMNFSNGNNRLSRILVANKDLRGKNIGEQIVRQLVERFFLNHDIQLVDLNTFSWNEAAIKCYQKVGFRIEPENTETMTIFGNSWTKINMTLSRDRFFSNYY